MFIDDVAPIANMTGKMLERLGYRIEKRLNLLKLLKFSR